MLPEGLKRDERLKIELEKLHNKKGLCTQLWHFNLMLCSNQEDFITHEKKN